MRLTSKKSAFLVVWLLLLVLPSLIGAGMAAQYEQEEPGAGGSLQIRLQAEDGAPYPPGDLVLSDPYARMTGSDSRANYN